MDEKAPEIAGAVPRVLLDGLLSIEKTQAIAWGLLTSAPGAASDAASFRLSAQPSIREGQSGL